MAYRYLFLLLDVVDDMYTARRSRTVEPDVDAKAGRRFVAAGAGTLFGKAHQLSEEVHQAMVARGYTGNARTLDGFRLRADRRLLDARRCAAVAVAVLYRIDVPWALTDDASSRCARPALRVPGAVPGPATA